MTLEIPDKSNKKRPIRKRNWRVGRANQKNVTQRSFGLVEKMFYYYKDIVKEVEQAHAERGYYQSGHKEGGGGSGHSFISNPTEQIALKHIAPVTSVIIRAEKIDEEVIRQPELWIKVVEQTLSYFSDNRLVTEVLRRRFFINEPMPTTCIMMEISKDIYYRMRDTGIMYARECAIQLGLIRVF